MRVLVTGGRGFVGSHLVEALREAGHEPVALGRRDGDLADEHVVERLLDEHAPDAVVHLAAAMPDDERLTQNAPMTAHVAAACARRGVRLLHGSTTSVYADDTPYAQSKRDSEAAAGDATLLRFHFPYGPRQRRGTIPTMLRQASARERVVVYRGWERSFCYASDVADAVVLLLERGVTGTWDVGRDDDRRSLLEIAQLACAVEGAAEDLIQVVDPPSGPALVLDAFDVTPLRELGWRPRVGLEDGMRLTFDWLASGAA